MLRRGSSIPSWKEVPGPVTREVGGIPRPRPGLWGWGVRDGIRPDPHRLVPTLGLCDIVLMIG